MTHSNPLQRTYKEKLSHAGVFLSGATEWSLLIMLQTVPIQELHEIVERRDTGSLDGVDERTKETITAAVNWLESE